MRPGKKYPALLVLIVAVAMPAVAGLKDIHTDKLPDDPAVRDAYAQLGPLESMARAWHPKWKYKTSKRHVASQLKASLTKLENAAKRAPENEELLLLLGLAANYSYNLDVKKSDIISVDALQKAQKLAPREDYRPAWFLDVHLCQSGPYLEGMKGLLKLERSMPWQKLPATFWDDYLECAILANMPEHALRAGAYASKLDPQPSPYRALLLETMRNHLVSPDPKATYGAKDVWSEEKSGPDVVFTSALFGLRFSVPGEWGFDIPDVQKAIGVANLQVGPFKGVSDMVIPNILVFVRPAKTGETLQDFLLAMAKDYKGSAIATPACPVHDCLALAATKPGGYKQDGDAYMSVTVFQRKAPEFPGLLFEEPTPLPEKNDNKPHNFRLGNLLQRFPGTLYYLVLLDTASSVQGKAEQAYKTFLQGIQVE